MKRLIFLLAFLLAIPVSFAESSEDLYTIDQACSTTLGAHAGQITSLQNDSRFRDVITDNNYSVGSFHHVNDTDWGDSVFFVANANGIAGMQQYSELFLVNCSPTSGQTAHFPIQRVEPNIGYSPEIIKITDSYILLDDYQTINGKSIHVSNIYNRKIGKFYPIRDEVIRSNKSIKTFSRNSQIFWNVLSFANTKIKLEVRLENGKKRNFTIKI